MTLTLEKLVGCFDHNYTLLWLVIITINIVYIFITFYIFFTENFNSLNIKIEINKIKNELNCLKSWNLDPDNILVVLVLINHNGKVVAHVPL